MLRYFGFDPRDEVVVVVLTGAGPTLAAEQVLDRLLASAGPYLMTTLLFLIGGFLVFWMAAGFAMLEAGLVRPDLQSPFRLRIPPLIREKQWFSHTDLQDQWNTARAANSSPLEAIRRFCDPGIFLFIWSLKNFVSFEKKSV